MDICFVAAGMAASGALTVSGAVYMWGQQSCGQLGDARGPQDGAPLEEQVESHRHIKVDPFLIGQWRTAQKLSKLYREIERDEILSHRTRTKILAAQRTLRLQSVLNACPPETRRLKLERARWRDEHKTPLVRAESLLEPETPRQFASTLRRRKEQGSLVRNKEAARARASKRSTKSPSPPPPLKKEPTKRTLAAKAAKPARKHAARPSQFGDLDRKNEFGVYDPVVEPEPLEEEDEEETVASKASKMSASTARSHHSAFDTARREHDADLAKLRKAASEQIHAASVPTIDDEFHAVKLAQHRLAKSRHAMRGHKKDGTRDDSHKVNAMEAIVRKRRDLGQVALRCNMRKIIDLCSARGAVRLRATGSIMCAAFDIDLCFHVEGLMRAHRLWARRKRKDRLRKKAFRIQTMNESALRKYRAISRGQDPRESDEEDESDDASDDDCLPDMRTHRHLQNIAEADVSDEEAEEEEPAAGAATVSDMRVFGCIVDSQHTEDITLRTRERTVTRVGETFIDRSVAARLKERRPSEVDISEDVDLDALLASVDDRQRALEEDAGGDGPRRRSRPASAARARRRRRRRREPTRRGFRRPQSAPASSRASKQRQANAALTREPAPRGERRAQGAAPRRDVAARVLPPPRPAKAPSPRPGPRPASPRRTVCEKTRKPAVPARRPSSGATADAPAPRTDPSRRRRFWRCPRDFPAPTTFGPDVDVDAIPEVAAPRAEKDDGRRVYRGSPKRRRSPRPARSAPPFPTRLGDGTIAAMAAAIAAAAVPPVGRRYGAKSQDRRLPSASEQQKVTREERFKRYLELNKFKDEAFVVPEPVRSSPRRGGSPRRPISAPCRRSGRRPASGRSMASMDPGAVSFLWVPSRAARRGAAGGRRPRARDDDYDAVADAIWHDDPGSDDDEDIPSWV
ncbi:hypothetical protein JL722_7123 [Aureococcus anophagefferens]|nr:hypothetical protein JL722_7123 [Aureococcus anophagefferens]